jgi:hypothetical protein
MFFSGFGKYIFEENTFQDISLDKFTECVFNSRTTLKVIKYFSEMLDYVELIENYERQFTLRIKVNESPFHIIFDSIEKDLVERMNIEFYQIYTPSLFQAFENSLGSNEADSYLRRYKRNDDYITKIQLDD